MFNPVDYFKQVSYRTGFRTDLKKKGVNPSLLPYDDMQEFDIPHLQNEKIRLRIIDNNKKYDVNSWINYGRTRINFVSRDIADSTLEKKIVLLYSKDCRETDAEICV